MALARLQARCTRSPTESSRATGGSTTCLHRAVPLARGGAEGEEGAKGEGVGRQAALLQLVIQRKGLQQLLLAHCLAGRVAGAQGDVVGACVHGHAQGLGLLKRRQGALILHAAAAAASRSVRLAEQSRTVETAGGLAAGCVRSSASVAAA